MNRPVLALAFLLALSPTSAFCQSNATIPRQGTADLGMQQGIRVGPGMNAASVGDYSYHNGAQPHRKRVLAWANVENGYQHDSVSHALATIERHGARPAVAK